MPIETAATIPPGPAGSVIPPENRTGLVVTIPNLGTFDVKVDPTFGPLSLAPLDCGTSPNTVGVHARSGPKSGVYGGSDTFDAVVGETYSDAHAGVTGRNLSRSPGPGAVGIYGVGGQHAGKFDGHVQINGDADITGNEHVHGTLQVDQDIILSAGRDCAEDFEIAKAVLAEPGTVMVSDDTGVLRPCKKTYDKKVAGVVSGAGDYRPGLILGRDGSYKDRAPIALVGRVFCKVDCQYGAIEVGDMLTTSPTPGHAMKVNDVAHAFGAAIGKALGALKTGTGLIPILVTLQ
jgi:hypothetical protein